ncbi:phage baseplate assembly protein V [Escherichia coli]|uniref:phage baseplate assembly protein V n=1 Tax=Escherichia coli TaxID=562 RepID=UPI001926C23D|nr:phage baseplate assembly protein V [Escherichia coli]
MENRITLPELCRRLCNLCRVGTVIAVKGSLVRVRTGDNETDWIRWLTLRAGDCRSWLAPSVGEQVLLLAPEGAPERAILAGSLYSGQNPPPDSGTAHTMRYPDGAVITYNPATSALQIDGVATVTLTASGHVSIHAATVTVTAQDKITLDAPEVECTQQLTTATFSAQKGGRMNGNFTGSVTFNNVRPDDHAHGGIKTGDSWTTGTR